MARSLSALVAMLVVLSLCPAAFAQSPSADAWVDYASGEYDIFPNLTYARAGGAELKLDLYLPKKHSPPVATVILFHGGGWVAGQKERNVLQLLPYLSMGCAVLNVEYRLAGASPAPAAVEDCLCALHWVTLHAGEYGFDTSRIVLTGGSAGGHLALITGMLPAGSPFDRGCPAPENTRWREGTELHPRVAAIVNWYGITDVAELLDGPLAKHYAIEWFGSMNGRKELAQLVSPMSYVRPGLPPILTLHGDKDDVVPYSQAVRLHAQLDRAGVPNQLETVQRAGHGGFNRQVLAHSVATIRTFLQRHHILTGG